MYKLPSAESVAQLPQTVHTGCLFTVVSSSLSDLVAPPLGEDRLLQSAASEALLIPCLLLARGEAAFCADWGSPGLGFPLFSSDLWF